MNFTHASSTFFCFIFVAILSSTWRGVSSQSQSLEVLVETFHRPGDGAVFTEDRTSAPSMFRSGKQLCARGLWALFTKPSYGMANISDVTVYPMKGGIITQCTGPTSIAGIIKNIQSFRRLAPDLPNVESPTEYCKNAYFLKRSSADCSTIPIQLNPVHEIGMIRSFALRGTGQFRACNDASPPRCVCMDLDGNGPYLVPDINAWPSKSAPFKKLSTITKAMDDDDKAECSSEEQVF